MEGTEALKQSLLDNYREVVELQNILKNRSLALELGSLISRMFPGKATDRKIEVISREIKARQKERSQNQVASRSAKPETDVSGSRVFRVQGDGKKKVHRRSEELVVTKGSRLRKNHDEDLVDEVDTTSNVEITFTGQPKELLELSPSDLETKLGGFDGMKEYGKTQLGLKFNNHSKTSVTKMIIAAIKNLKDVPDSSEEE